MIDSEQYQLLATLSQVTAAHHARARAIDSLLVFLGPTAVVDESVIQEWEQRNKASKELTDALLSNSQNNLLVRRLDLSLRGVDRVGDKIIDMAKSAMASHAPTLTESVRNDMLKELSNADKAAEEIRMTRSKYTIEVRTYNEIISAFPTSWTAKIFGEDMRVGLDEETDKLVNAGKMIDVAIGSAASAPSQTGK